MKIKQGVWALGAMDELANLKALGPNFARAVEFLQANDLDGLGDGRHEISGDSVFVSIGTSDFRKFEDAKPELHRRYFDIQIPLSKPDTIGVGEFTGVFSDEFDIENDVGFYEGMELENLEVKKGEFLLVYPGVCAHRPCCSADGEGKIRKAVVKVLS